MAFLAARAGRFAKNGYCVHGIAVPCTKVFKRKLMNVSPYTLFRLQSLQSSIFS